MAQAKRRRGAVGPRVRVEKALGRQNPEHVVFTVGQVEGVFFIDIEHIDRNGEIVFEWILV